MAGLADFSRLVLLEMFATDTPPAGELPRRHLRVNPKRLDWLMVLTPDFRLSEQLAGGPSGRKPSDQDLYRVHLGLDRESGEPRLVHISKKPVGTKATPPEQLVELRDPLRIAGWWLPKRMFLWERQPLARSPALKRFADAPADREAHILKGSKLNPPIESTEFDPNKWSKKD